MCLLLMLVELKRSCSVKQVYLYSNRRVRGFSRETSCVAWKLFKISQNTCVRTVNLEIRQHPAKIRSFFLEPHILLNNFIVALQNVVQPVDEIMVLRPKTKKLGPELVQVPLLPHPRPPCGFPVGNHSPLLSLVDDAHLMLLGFVGG
ncbi:uncharacterized protein LOC110011590 [Sesamum indicum]|uniref:Uncharacterized protein LOC110011590 n=1 Tax=Sesamum indicum TaxID=4182 RepID=A0A8M8ULG3_SESIN|nr:uncharacterized protein LOC110011590 [Sesamum indicum]